MVEVMTISSHTGSLLFAFLFNRLQDADSSEAKGSIYLLKTIHIYSGITSGRVLDGELLFTKILVSLFTHLVKKLH